MKPNDTPIRILIAEDHRLFLELLKGLCERTFGYQVVGTAETGAETILLAKKVPHDVILLDLNLPDMDGVDAAKTLLAGESGVKIVAVSSQIDDYTLHRVMDCGIQGYVDKNAQSTETLKVAIQTVAQGGIYFTPVMQQVRLAFKRDPDAFPKILSDREQQVLSLFGRGLSNEEVGRRLGIKPGAAMSHRRNIMLKLNLSGASELVRYALDHGFVRQKPRRD